MSAAPLRPAPLNRRSTTSALKLRRCSEEFEGIRIHDKVAGVLTASNQRILILFQLTTP